MNNNIISELSKFYFENTSDNINGVGYGYMYKNGVITPELGLVFSVYKKLPKDEVPEGELIPIEVSLSGETLKTDVIEQSFVPLQSLTGCPPDFYNWQDPLYQVPNRLEVRPLQGGLGTTNWTELGGKVGTIGLLAIDNDTNSLVGISNTHVWVKNAFIDSDRNPTDPPTNALNNIIVQPNPSDDSGVYNPIGIVKKYYPLYVNDYNYIDAAISTINSEDVDLSTSYRQYGITGWTSPMEFATSEEIDNLLINQNPLYSSGRSSGAKGEGEMKLLCSAINAYAVVSPYENGSSSLSLDFARNIFFVASATTKSPPGVCPYPIAPGDSGSALLADINGVRKIVGICYASSMSIGVANRIDDVANLLNIRAWTGETSVNFSDTTSTETLLLTTNSDDPYIDYESKRFWQVGLYLSAGNTPTPTPTTSPTPTMFFCGSGVTTGTYYYYDCCGYVKTGYAAGVVVTMDYSKPFSGVEKLNFSATQICPTPTNTPTPSITPTNTPTPSVTFTKTPTPTITPTNTPYPNPPTVLVPKNECDVFTIFDMGISCYVMKQPVSETSFDGELKILVTGGTAPYQFTWNNGQKVQTLTGLKPGQYGVTVVDFYGDYTGSTVCSLVALTPTPTVTPTLTQTPTSTFVCPDICFTMIPQELSIGGGTYYGPWQFVCNGTFNGKRKWSYGAALNIIWIPTKNRWEMVENDFVTPVYFDNGAIVASTTTSDIPLNLWSFYGNQPIPYTFNVVVGDCPTGLPFIVTVESVNTQCPGTQNCSGSLIFTPTGGQSPYLFSIDNGATYKTSNVFTSLCAGTYITKAKDSNNVIIARQVTISTNQQNISYLLTIQSNGSVLNQIPNFSSQNSQFSINLNPSIPVGTTVTFTINIGFQISNMGPWFDENNPNTTAEYTFVPMLFKNNVDISSSLTLGTVTTSIVNRPGCNPSEMEITTGTYVATITMTNGDVITGSTLCELTEINPVQLNGCVSTIQSDISIFTTTPTISGCYCCSIINGNQPVLFNQSLQGQT